MSLRRKLIILNASFAIFAVAVACATIYGVDVHLRATLHSFQGLMDQSLFLERLQVEAEAELSRLHDVIAGRRADNDAYRSQHDAFFTRLAEAGRFAGAEQGEPARRAWAGILEVGLALRASMDQTLALATEGRASEADELLNQRIERDLIPALNQELQEAQRIVDAARRDSAADLLAVDSRMLVLAVMIGAGGAGLVALGAIFVRRWFIAPLGMLEAGTREFAQGRLTHRVPVAAEDELGSLGHALNSMASALRTSQTKYRSLFENLRDALIIVDQEGRVVECRDADPVVLGGRPDAANGRLLLDCWPQWASGPYDWEKLIHRVAVEGERIRAVGVSLPQAGGSAGIVDVVAYPVEYDASRYAAIVLRDASERHRLQRMSQRADTLVASVHFARGIAHDFKNLLNSAMTTLSLIREGNADAERAQKAILACQQAAGLSRKLSEFAETGTGRPELLCLSATIRLILCSIEESLGPSITLVQDCADPILVLMDRDHLTQAALNIIQNAREAMENGGQLTVRTSLTDAVNPLLGGEPRKYALLTVTDTGCGMTSSVKDRLFEPLFSTKERGSYGQRGMGLAIAYAAVAHADGFVQVDSQPGAGTTFRVYFPCAGTNGRRVYGLTST